MKKGLVQKTIAVLLGAAIALPTGTGALAAGASTAHAGAATKHAASVNGHWAQQVMQEWKDKGYINGYADGGLHPNDRVTRAQLAALINRSSGFTAASEISFKDVSGKAWYAGDVAKAAAAGYMKGDGNGSFRPTGEVTRQELAVVLALLLKLEPDANAAAFSDTVGSPAWSKGAIGAVTKAGLMQGSGARFNPAAAATRAEVVTVLDRAAKQAAESAVTYDKAGTYGPEKGTETLKGSVNVTQSGVTLRNTVIEGDLLLGKQIANGDVTLENVTVKGTTKIEGGGPNSIHIVDSVLVTVLVDKRDGSVRIVTEGSSSVSQITLQSGAFLQEAGTGSGFGNVRLSELIPAGSTVRMAGQFESLEVSAASLNVNLSSGSIGEVTVGEGAAGTNLNVSAAARIARLILNAAANVTGTGAIERAQVNASGTSFQTRPQQLNVGAGVSAPSVAASGPASTGGPASTSGGSNGGGNAAAPVPVTDRLEVANGSAVLQFVNPVSGLTLADLNVTATVTESAYAMPYTLESLNFDAASNKLTFAPISLDEHYGETLQVKVTPAAGTTKFSASLSGSALIEGFSGIVTDVDNRPVADMRIDFRRGMGNVDGAVAASVSTDANGRYTVYAPAGIYTGVTSKAGFISGTVVAVGVSDTYNRSENHTAIKIPAGDEIRIVLTWGERPRDEDSHLLGPAGDGYGFHTWFGEKQAYDEGELIADLDHDDTSSFGPETTTIRKKMDGTYQFYVHNYSGNGAGDQTLRNSGAKVDVYVGSQALPVKSYTIPAGTGSEIYWYVFDMTLNGSDIAFTDRNEFADRAPTALYGQTRPSTEGILNEEAYKLLSVTDVTYRKRNENVPLTLEGTTIREDVDFNIKQIREVGVTDDVYTVVGDVYTVTGNVYIGKQGRNIVFTNYNLGTETVVYKVSVELSLNGRTLERDIEVVVPELHDLLEQIMSRAAAKLEEQGADPQLQSAYDRAAAALNAEEPEAKIAAYESLVDLLR
ncbi:S-layer homology domain-containing protein [Saccharibacillus alkalitolerans]|uniref:S-layer protein n=1 Tax=Saccharibacillus alkalitolerans TaxID=2705290 RepID=A0ABX0F524_9BACL|nr:S-layer homology domain-containing protein [Saccharibacillus alkalitolerans]NGZ76051.1 S-layer protein [Saccharibacillus alkalitolerans]